jgi:hypothetical protein
MNIEKLKVNKFMLGLNLNIHVKVRILMPKMLHDEIQKDLIAEEEMNNGGQGRTPSRKRGKVPPRASQYHTLDRHTSRYHETPT